MIMEPERIGKSLKILKMKLNFCVRPLSRRRQNTMIH